MANGQQQQNRYQPQISGSEDYAQYLQNPYAQPMQVEQPQGAMGKAGSFAFFLDKFIQGAQQGQYKRQLANLLQEQRSEKAVNQYLQLLNDKDPVAAQQLRQQIVTEQGKRALSFLSDTGKGGKGKQGGPFSPIMNAMKSIGEGLVGGPVKKWEGYGQMGEWAQQILNMPSKEQAQQRDLGQFNQLVQNAISKAKTGDPNKEIFFEDIARDPAVVAGANKFQSYYGFNPLAQISESGAYPSTRGMTGAEIEARTEQAKASALEARTEREALEVVSRMPGPQSAPPGGRVLVPGPRGGVVGSVPVPSASATPTQTTSLTPRIEDAFRMLGNKYIADEEMTLGDRTGVPVKHVKRGPWMGYYDAAGRRLPDEYIAANAGKVFETPAQIRAQKQEEWDREQKARLEMFKQEWQLRRADIAGDRMRTALDRIEDRFEQRKVQFQDQWRMRRIQVAQWAETQGMSPDKRDQLLAFTDAQWQAADNYQNALHENRMRIAEGLHAVQPPDSVTQDTSRAINNPGMIRDPATGSFRVFGTQQDGWNALKDLIGGYVGGRIFGVNANSSITDMMRKYSPVEDGNDPEQAAKNIAGFLGVSPDTKIGTLMNRINDFAAAIARQEGRTPKDVIETLRKTGVASQPGTAAPPGGRATTTAGALFGGK